MSEATYRSNARILLEGDDCFRMEQLYSADIASNEGALVLSFLPEKEDNQGSSDEEDADDEEEEDDAPDAAKGEWSAYMQSFVLTSTRATASRVLLKRTASSAAAPESGAGVMLNGLQCRSTVGGCKLRFVWQTEDLFFGGAVARWGKRSGSLGGSRVKRRKLARFCDAHKGPAGDSHDALHGVGPGTPAPLPHSHKLKEAPLPDV